MSLDALKSWYENMQPSSLREMELFYGEDCYFKDPFNELNGLENVKKIFSHMFDNLEEPRFHFIEAFEQGQSAFLTWDFTFKFQGKKAAQQYKIHGSSHLKFDASGKVVYHRDYWDVGEEVLAKIPLVKTLYGMLCSKLSV